MDGTGRLEGKIAVVTGAARGIGAAIAERFSAEGATVVLADVLGDELAATAGALGSPVRAQHLDVASEADWGALATICGEDFGGIDVLVNNAGIMRAGTVETLSLEDYRAVIEVNQIGCFLGMQFAIGLMRRRGGGSIINMSSVAGLYGTTGVLAYSASKWAVRGMTRSAAVELSGSGIRVNSIHPGTTDTPMVNRPEFGNIDREAFGARLPAGRIGVPADVASLALFLASDESAYCTGAEFVVDGGATCGARR